MRTFISLSGSASDRASRGQHAVELKLRTPHQLFDERDPSPFRERDLDDDAASYIHGSYRDLRDHPETKLSIYFESLEEFTDRPQIIVDAIHAFFRYQADTKRRELRETFRLGSVALAIGVAFLFFCTSLSQTLKAGNFGWGLGPMVNEGLVIMGWVAMWRPISIFLYEWWPIRDALATHVKLSRIDVEIRSQKLVPDRGPEVASLRRTEASFLPKPRESARPMRPVISSLIN